LTFLKRYFSIRNESHPPPVFQTEDREVVTASENDRFFAFSPSSPLTLGPQPPTDLNPGHSLVPYPAQQFRGGGSEYGSVSGSVSSGGHAFFFAPGLGGPALSVASWRSAGPGGPGRHATASAFEAAAAPTHHGRLWTAGTLRPATEVLEGVGKRGLVGG
jgi:hypothetical protein